MHRGIVRLRAFPEISGTVSARVFEAAVCAQLIQYRARMCPPLDCIPSVLIWPADDNLHFFSGRLASTKVKAAAQPVPGAPSANFPLGFNCRDSRRSPTTSR